MVDEAAQESTAGILSNWLIVARHLYRRGNTDVLKESGNAIPLAQV